jgi:hypothetical protein
MNLELAIIESLDVEIFEFSNRQELTLNFKCLSDGVFVRTGLAHLSAMESLLNYSGDDDVSDVILKQTKNIEEINKLWKAKNLNSYRELKGHTIFVKMSGNTVQEIDWNPKIEGGFVIYKFK